MTEIWFRCQLRPPRNPLDKTHNIHYVKYYLSEENPRIFGLMRPLPSSESRIGGSI